MREVIAWFGTRNYNLDNYSLGLQLPTFTTYFIVVADKHH